MKSNQPHELPVTVSTGEAVPPLLASLRELILQTRQRVLTVANTAQVQTYWEIGRHLVEFEQGGETRAAYGTALLTTLAKSLTAEFGKGFDASNLRNMRLFYQAFPIRDALRPELSWTHYRLLLRVDDSAARQWYMQESASQNWSTRILERQIGSLSYERLLSNQSPGSMAIAPSPATAKDFVRDPVLLEFLGLPDSGRLREGELESALMDNLQKFLLELGKGFAFVARQQRLSTETQDFYIDLVFYNYLLKCFVLIDLKVGHLTHQDIGQMDMYVRLYDDLRRGDGDNPTVGILLCGSKDQSVVRYSVLHDSEQLFASKYRLVLPSEEVLRQELEREQVAISQLRELDASQEGDL